MNLSQEEIQTLQQLQFNLALSKKELELAEIQLKYYVMKLYRQYGLSDDDKINADGSVVKAEYKVE